MAIESSSAYNFASFSIWSQPQPSTNRTELLQDNKLSPQLSRSTKSLDCMTAHAGVVGWTDLGCGQGCVEGSEGRGWLKRYKNLDKNYI